METTIIGYIGLRDYFGLLLGLYRDNGISR